MLKKVLKEIYNSKYISKRNIAHKLNISEELVEEALIQLDRMGYIKKNDNINNCNISCNKCPYANHCNKVPLKTITITEKGKKLLKLNDGEII
ncbi:FeoC-like transcriptional regulator [Keratinibaculum paraultunense]|uniref:FeoC-like transcriptional regulator n=1 Tax=Keratinibaculum paraultunense TaxID=1278232 RepID=A0A4R3KTZ2_9FIRM|nr:FeoC-like transcriptional regulator [Keratinibaculum paraultunense]QQY79824.1 hypothetical protein JL105_00350 [Keratinibaculum paraultunense]TCS88705.1 FeoC-like transcriptional regulator [Keratinibaculum paraultunense]